MAVVLGLPVVLPRLDRDQVFAVWTVARAEANLAYDVWLDAPGPETYAIYRAAEDRADAAQDALAGLDAPVAAPATPFAAAA
jgi:hypothetical protein